jgi:hypothetical protein
LAEHAGDFLAGSCRCIEEAHQVVVARVRDKPQVLTINLPSTATHEDEALAVSEARAVTPDHVTIKVQRYRQPPQSRWWRRLFFGAVSSWHGVRVLR